MYIHVNVDPWGRITQVIASTRFPGVSLEFIKDSKQPDVTKLHADYVYIQLTSVLLLRAPLPDSADYLQKHTNLSAWLYVYVFVYVWICICVYVYVCVYIYMCVCVCMYVCVCVDMYVYVYVYVYMYI